MFTSNRAKGIALIVLGIFALASLLTYFGGKDGRNSIAYRNMMLGVDDGDMMGEWFDREESVWTESSGGAGYAGKMAVGAPAPMMDSAVAIGMMPPYEPSAGPTAGDAVQRVIKNGSLDLVVDDVQESIARVTSIAVAQKGFVQQSSVNERGDGTFGGYITVRVSSEAFEPTMAEIRGIANVVKSESVSGQDVTEQYTDLEARLRNAEAQEATYLAVLDDAKSVEDILAVQRELSNIRYQIESLEGQRQYLENQTSYSTISVSLAEEAALRVPTKEFRPLASMKEAAQALVRVFQSLVILVIWLLIIGIGIAIPFLLFWMLVLWVVRTAWKKYLKGNGSSRRK